MNTSPDPVLVYDGDCGFCRYCVEYARALDAPGLTFEPFQSAAPRYPEVSLAEFRAAVQLFEPDGRHTSAAEASFRVLALGGRPLALRLYRHVPGVRAVSEAAYHFVAAHRGAFYRICLPLFGSELRPATHARVDGLFLRGLGLIVIAAFASFLVQAMGLIGSEGIVPLQAWLDTVRERTGSVPWLRVPTLFWLGAGDTAIRALCWAGIAGGVLLAAGLRSRLVLLALYISYLSLVIGGQMFMGYQWDSLLVEVCFHALLLLAWPTLGRWACRWLLFRFMLEAGFAKLASYDPTWASWTALRYHFETQPLPTPLAWYAHNVAPVLLHFATGITLVIELLLPFLIFMPRRVRLAPFAGFVVLQALILASGNYSFFNLLVLVLCLQLLDDRALPRWLARAPIAPRTPWQPGLLSRAAALAGCVLVALISIAQFGYLTNGRRVEGWRIELMQATQPWLVCNTYGLFASMTTKRPEIVLEGSNDGTAWEPYEFRYKPGDPARALSWNIPHQPRLDWQLWFAALQPDTVQPWVYNLAVRLLSGSEPVRALLAGDAWRDAPPRYLRAQLWLYRYSTREERAAGAGSWQRELLGDYLPPVSLQQEAGGALER